MERIAERIQVAQELQARAGLIRIFEELGYVDGASLTNEQIKAEKKPMFWEDILDTSIAQSKPYYIVFKIGTSTSEYADNKIMKSNLAITIDVFTTKNIASEGTYALREALEKKFKESAEFNELILNTKFYDSRVNLNQISYSTSKDFTFDA